MTAIRWAGRTAVCALLLASGAAVADTKVGAELGLTAGAASNPYGASGGDNSAATLAGSFRPNVTLTSPTGSTSLTGSVTHTEYSRRYDGETDYTVGAATSQQISPFTSLTGGASYSSQFRNTLYPVVDPVTGLPNNPNGPIIVDPSGSTSFAERIESISGNIGLSTILSPRDRINFSARGASVTYPGNSIVARSYDRYSAGASYLRQVGANTSIGLGVDAARSNYRRTNLGDGTQISPSVILQTKLAPRLSLQASLGVTFSNTEVLTGKQNFTSLYGTASLCNNGERSSLCADASRTVAPSGTTGTSEVTALGLSYSYRLTPRSDISARASYSSSTSLDSVGRSKTDFGQASINYSRQLTERLSGVVSLTYSDTYSSFNAQGASFYGSVGIRYRLGNLG